MGSQTDQKQQTATAKTDIQMDCYVTFQGKLIVFEVNGSHRKKISQYIYYKLKINAVDEHLVSRYHTELSTKSDTPKNFQCIDMSMNECSVYGINAYVNNIPSDSCVTCKTDVYVRKFYGYIVYITSFITLYLSRCGFWFRQGTVWGIHLTCPMLCLASHVLQTLVSRQLQYVPLVWNSTSALLTHSVDKLVAI